MKRVISTLALCVGAFWSVNAQAALSDQEILDKIEALQRQVASQQEVIDTLKKQVEKNEAVAGPSKITLANSLIDQLTIKGDLRARFETRQIDKDSGDENRDRLRTRFRIGGIWQNTAENWEVGAGLATGSTDATSTNATWSESSPFETGDIRLDYAYGKHKWNDFTFTAGQHINPYETSWIFWDSDARFTGFTGGYKSDAGLFTTVGAYGVRYYQAKAGNYNTAMLYAGQAGYTGKAGDLKYTLAAGYHTYDKSFINEESSTGGLLEDVDPNKYELNIGDIYGDVNFPLGSAKMTVYAQAWQNFGADGNAGQGQVGGTLLPDQEDTGWILGINSKINDFKIGYAYTRVESDSLYGGLKDADFGTGLNNTDIQGHRIDLAYNFTKNVSAGITAMLYEAIELDKPDVDLYQFDLNYKF
ncbi:MAG: putative porin [Proteobacteria bacterium]|nr:putative porin [Pseudomonadota bacterium]MBU4294561.1 putative porin [Pseudomonadota bacterium]MCG2747097.1 putative porin [Desulfobulbaceae bacterium]